MSKASRFIPQNTSGSGGGSGASIDDTSVASDKTWSSLKLSKVPDIFSITTGVNTYTLSGTPIVPAISKVLLNGVDINYTTMYSISGNQITLIPTGLEFYLADNDVLKVWWF